MGIDWTSILNQIVAVIVPVVITALGLLGMIVLNRLRAWAAASEELAKDALRKSAADQGVAKAKEMSAVQFQTTGVAMTGQQKQAIAISVVAAKAPDTTPADAKSTVIAAVGAASGEGASGKSQGSA